MNKINSFFDTAAVFLGNLLRLRPVSWSEAKKAAEEMRAMMAANVAGKIEVVDGESAAIKPMTPYRFLADALGAALGFVFAVWLVVQIISGFLALLPYMLVIAAVLLVYSIFAGGDTVTEPTASAS